MEPNESSENKKPSEPTPGANKSGKLRLPSKPIVFGNQHPNAKNGKQGKAGSVSKNKKGGAGMQRKTFGM